MKYYFLRFERGLSTAVLFVACLLLAVVSVLGMVQVLSRFVFNQPLSWSEVLIRLLIIWMVMFGVVIAFRRGAQISVDMMFRLSGRFQRPLHFLISVIAILFLVRHRHHLADALPGNWRYGNPANERRLCRAAGWRFLRHHCRHRQFHRSQA